MGKLKKNILLFCDPGIDDSLAIMYALLNPAFNVVGLVTGYGNIDQEQATQNAAYLLTLAGREDVVLIGGAKGPLSGEFVPYYPEIHGEEGLGPIQPPETIVGELLNYDSVFKLIEQYDGDLIIVDVGRLTSLAIGFILGGDDVMNSVQQFYLMGGAFFVPGNVTPAAEANFYGDPIAADLVLEKAQNVALYPLNVTNKAIITPEVIDTIAETENNPFQPLMKAIFDYYYEAYKKLVPSIPGSPLHDVLTLYAVANPEKFGYTKRRVRVETAEGPLKGATIADFRPRPEEEDEEKEEYIALEFDYDDFVEDFIRVMTRKLPENSVENADRKI